MSPVVYDLFIGVNASEKLGRRAISAEEAEQLLWNKPVLRENHRSPQGTHRVLLIGVTNGGRRLTLVIEATPDPTAWSVITGWDA